MKVIAIYLPQFHVIPENEEWWGKGFTEWTTVKNGVPLFEGHVQPKIPLNHNYYNLLDINTMRWQVKIAKEYGIYGFCFYHYWFGGKLMLEKPVENFLLARDIDFHYCLSWANEHWTNQWISDKQKVLIEQRYGDRTEWKEHFKYLVQFFHDPRYIKYEGKPVFMIYRPELIDKRKEMLAFWNELAIQEGFLGICFVFQQAGCLLDDASIDMSMFDFCAPGQPGFTFKLLSKQEEKLTNLRSMKRKMFLFLEKHFKVDPRGVHLLPHKEELKIYDYDKAWNVFLSSEKIFKNTIPSAFTNWDCTPRKGSRGSVMKGVSVEKFRQYFKRLIEKAKEDGNPTDLLIIFAWNEWSEGGYLEPDEEDGYGYLTAIKSVLTEMNEIPVNEYEI